MVQLTHPPPSSTTPHMSMGSCPGWFTSNPASSLWPGKAVDNSTNPWAPVSMWETRQKLLAIDWLSSSHCRYLVSDSTDERSVSLSFSHKPALPMKKIYIFFKKKNKSIKITKATWGRKGTKMEDTTTWFQGLLYTTRTKATWHLQQDQHVQMCPEQQHRGEEHWPIPAELEKSKCNVFSPKTSLPITWWQITWWQLPTLPIRQPINSHIVVCYIYYCEETLYLWGTFNSHIQITEEKNCSCS